MALTKNLLIVIQGIIIAVFVSVFFLERNKSDQKKDEYINQLTEQNKLLKSQIKRLKGNFIEIGIIDSIQSKSIDSLITISNKKLKILKNESTIYRAALNNVSDKGWKKLSEEQKAEEISEAINFLKLNEE